MIELAINGQISVGGRKLVMPDRERLAFRSEMSDRDRWFNDLHLNLAGDQPSWPRAIDPAAVDDALRGAALPFDGLSDLALWLSLPDPSRGREPPSLTIRVGPPADIALGECRLVDDELTLTILAHPNLDISDVGLAVRAAPSLSLKTRKQASEAVVWDEAAHGTRSGHVRINLAGSDQALAVLMIGGSSVRRQWFQDPKKTRNDRVTVVQQFDVDLKRIRHALLEQPTDSTKFELGVAALFFMLGFSPMVQIETESPDLVVVTPGGRIAIVECTLRIADYFTKRGKLVDRRGALLQTLRAGGHRAEIFAILVCALPRDQIATDPVDLAPNNVILFSKETLQEGFARLRGHIDPDLFLSEVQTRNA
jgi:hypothetical protein